MECERFPDEKLLMAHIELGPAPEFEAHLAGCAGCRTDVEEMRDVRRRYSRTSGETMPDRLRSRLLAMRPRVGRPQAWQRWVTVGAAAVLLCVLVLSLVRTGAPKPPEDVASQRVDLTFTWQSFEEVRAQLPKKRPPRPARDLKFDREVRELKKKIENLNEDEW